MRIGVDYGGDDCSAVTLMIPRGDGVFIVDTLRGESADAFMALLRLARAVANVDEDFMGHEVLEEVRATLKEVEHLL